MSYPWGCYPLAPIPGLGATVAMQYSIIKPENIGNAIGVAERCNVACVLAITSRAAKRWRSAASMSRSLFNSQWLKVKGV